MIFVLIVIGLIAAFIGWLAFTSRADVSRDARFAPYLHRLANIASNQFSLEEKKGKTAHFKTLSALA